MAAVDMLKKGDDAYRQKNYGGALSYYTKAVEENPEEARAYSGLGKVYYRKKDLEKAVKNLKKAISLGLKDASTYYALGMALEDSGQLEEALDFYVKTAELKPDFWQAHYSKGMLFLELDCYVDAILAFTEVLKIKPDYTEAQLQRGNAMILNKVFKDAVEDFRSVLKKTTKDARAYNGLGLALENLGAPEEALENYKKAFELDPENLNLKKRIDDLNREIRKKEGTLTQGTGKGVSMDEKRVEVEKELEKRLTELDRRSRW